MASDNRTLGRFMLDGILPAPRGIPQIEVSFDIDANGIISVKALDKGTGKEQKITITASSGLSKEEVEKMQREAELHSEEDARKRDEVEVRNVADTLIYNAEKTMREQGEKVPADLKQSIDDKITALQTALQGTDIERIRSGSQELSEAMQKVGAAVYEQAGGQQPPQSPDEQTPPEDEGTVEGEFREV